MNYRMLIPFTLRAGNKTRKLIVSGEPSQKKRTKKKCPRLKRRQVSACGEVRARQILGEPC